MRAAPRHADMWADLSPFLVSSPTNWGVGAWQGRRIWGLAGRVPRVSVPTSPFWVAGARRRRPWPVQPRESVPTSPIWVAGAQKMGVGPDSGGWQGVYHVSLCQPPLSAWATAGKGAALSWRGRTPACGGAARTASPGRARGCGRSSRLARGSPTAADAVRGRRRTAPRCGSGRHARSSPCGGSRRPP